MDEITVVVDRKDDVINISGSPDWWGGVAEEDAILSFSLDGGDGGLWSGNFVPPPPRPLFLDDSAAPDGLTTCDLCSWAWKSGNAFSFDAKLEAPGEIGWVLTLIIVSLVSAIIGAIVMIVVLHCKSRLKLSRNDLERNPNSQHRIDRPPINTPEDKSLNTLPPMFQNSTNNGVWSWLSRRSSTVPSQLQNPPTGTAENHYTHMEENYNSTDEALYAELDRESTVERDSNSPAYQNSAYADPDAPSAPSSAYYSDLSQTTVPDRAYEVVGLSTMTVWDANTNSGGDARKPPVRLAAITESSSSVPSDYV